MAAFNVTTKIFAYMDTVVADFVASNLSVIIATVTPLVGIALTMSLMIQGLYAMAQPDGEPLTDLLQKFVRYGVIISIASAGGWYQTTLANAALKTPDEFSKVLIINGSDGGQQEKMSSTIDSAIDKSLDTSKKAFENAGITSGAGIASAFLGVMVLISAAYTCGIGAGLIVMAKFLLGVTVSFGPIFIFCLLFDATRDLFSKWIGSIINFSLVTILLSSVFGLMIKFYSVSIAAAATGDTPILVPVFTAGLMSVVTHFVMKNIPEMAASWGQGIAAAYKRGASRPTQGGGGEAEDPAPSGTERGSPDATEGGGGAAGAGAGAGSGAGGAAAAAASSGKARGSRAG